MDRRMDSCKHEGGLIDGWIVNKTNIELLNLTNPRIGPRGEPLCGLMYRMVQKVIKMNVSEYKPTLIFGKKAKNS
jgi:hypothetical protein